MSEGAKPETGNEALIEVIVAERLWQVVTIDFLSGFLPSVPGGWQGCIVVCNRFSRIMYVKEYGTHPIAKEAAALFIQLVVRAHRVPRKIISDRYGVVSSPHREDRSQGCGSGVPKDADKPD